MSRRGPAPSREARAAADEGVAEADERVLHAAADILFSEGAADECVRQLQALLGAAQVRTVACAHTSLLPVAPGIGYLWKVVTVVERKPTAIEML